MYDKKPIGINKESKLRLLVCPKILNKKVRENRYSSISRPYTPIQHVRILFCVTILCIPMWQRTRRHGAVDDSLEEPKQ